MELQQCSDVANNKCRDKVTEDMIPNEGVTSFLFLMLFSKECEHERDYLRLHFMIEIFLVVCAVCAYCFYFEIWTKDCDLIKALVMIGTSMCLPFLIIF